MDSRVRAVSAFLAERIARGPVDAREEAALRRFAAELEVLPRPFDQDAGPVHVTASAIVTGPPGVLLHRHKRLGIWLQPGGHLDAGEDLLAAALREVREETGLTGSVIGVTPVHVDVHGGGRGHVHLDLRWLVATDGDPEPAAGESPDVRWFTWTEALAHAEAGLAGALRALRPPSAVGRRPSA